MVCEGGLSCFVSPFQVVFGMTCGSDNAQRWEKRGGWEGVIGWGGGCTRYHAWP